MTPGATKAKIPSPVGENILVLMLKLKQRVLRPTLTISNSVLVCCMPGSSAVPTLMQE